MLFWFWFYAIVSEMWVKASAWCFHTAVCIDVFSPPFVLVPSGSISTNRSTQHDSLRPSIVYHFCDAIGPFPNFFYILGCQ